MIGPCVTSYAYLQNPRAVWQFMMDCLNYLSHEYEWRYQPNSDVFYLERK